MMYEIKVKGHLDPLLSNWLGGLTISHVPTGHSLLTGMVIDQSALYALIMRCRDLGLTLVSINPSSNKEKWSI